MGQNTRRAQECFSELISLATLPCSLTAFKQTASLIGRDFSTPEAMRGAVLPPQGQTNITEGIETALDVIKQQHKEENERGSSSASSTHHVLVLLSDGAHNVGPHPNQQLPLFGASLRGEMPELRLSVVVVGVTGSSDTSMGMLLKQSLETVPMELLEPIYFAPNAARMTEVLGELSAGLASLRGSLVRMALLPSEQGCGSFVKAIGEDLAGEMTFMASGKEQCFLLKGTGCPQAVDVAGEVVQCEQLLSAEDFDVELAAAALQPLLASARIKRVAGQPESNVRAAVEQLNQLLEAIEGRCSDKKRSQGDEFQLKKLLPQDRVAQHKAKVGLLQHVKELRNQLAEIEAFQTSSSAEQAAFLTGKSSKYGSKALLRAAANRSGASSATAQVDTQQFLASLFQDTAARAAELRAALREDSRAKVSYLSEAERASLKTALLQSKLAPSSLEVVDALCSGEVCKETDDLIDRGALVDPLQKLLGGVRQSYLSLNAPWEQLAEWCSAAADAEKVCSNEYQLLMYLGSLGYPVEVRRRAATQMNPYAMDVLKVHASIADTASLCCAMHSSEALVPPEGGKTIEDLLVLVDPDVPRASLIVANSMLLKEAYTSVVLCRDLYMYSGNSMRIALHAHSLLATVQPPAETKPQEDIIAELRRLHLGHSYQCGGCGFGPVSHTNCYDLGSHHGERDARGGVVNNACPSCGWFSDALEDWEPWNGEVPAEFLEGTQSAVKVSEAACAEPAAATEASLELALRICYSARKVWSPKVEGEMHELCQKLSCWGDSLTAADGVEHPIKLLLALACCDEVAEGSLATPAVLALLNEVCARHAHDEIKAATIDGRSRVRSFLSVDKSSAPACLPLGESEPAYAAVKESCRSDYELDGAAFNFKKWVWKALQPWLPALRFVRRLRACLAQREGGWKKLQADMERGSTSYRDVVEFLKTGGSGDQTECEQEKEGGEHSLVAALDIKSAQLKRTMATMAAQAFMHESSQSRRLKELGGNLEEPLGDVRDGETLRSLAVDLRMETYMQGVAEKMRQWQNVGAEMTCARARVADIGQFGGLIGSHAHGLDGPTFWGLWYAAKADGGVNGEKALAFLKKANQPFCEKYHT